MSLLSLLDGLDGLDACEVEKLMRKSTDVLALDDSQLGCTDVVYRKIETGDHLPVPLRLLLSFPTANPAQLPPSHSVMLSTLLPCH